MEEIKVNLDNLTSEEREMLMSLVKKGNEDKLNIKYPKIGTKYYYIDDQGNICVSSFSESCYSDRYKYEHDNFFLTYKEAEFEQERQKVLFELKYWGNGYKYFNKEKNNYYTLCYSNKENKIYIIKQLGIDFYEINYNFYFESPEKIKNAIKQVGEDRIKKYLFGIEI